MKTVKQLADLAGITARTLRWYDRIGLLEPSRSGDNGYRLYGEEDALVLQQILFYRELGLPLEEIARIVKDPAFDPLAALESHRAAIADRIGRLRRLAESVDETIAHLKEGLIMEEKKLFRAFSEEETEALRKEAEAEYDPETVRASHRLWNSYSGAKKKEILDEGNRIYAELAKEMSKGPGAPEVQALVGRWREHMSNFWTPEPEQLAPLAAMYAEDPRFRSNFESFAPGLAEFMAEAVAEYVRLNFPPA